MKAVDFIRLLTEARKFAVQLENTQYANAYDELCKLLETRRQEDVNEIARILKELKISDTGH
jgi:hypothetical protein